MQTRCYLHPWWYLFCKIVRERVSMDAPRVMEASCRFSPPGPGHLGSSGAGHRRYHRIFTPLSLRAASQSILVTTQHTITRPYPSWLPSYSADIVLLHEKYKWITWDCLENFTCSGPQRYSHCLSHTNDQLSSWKSQTTLERETALSIRKKTLI